MFKLMDKKLITILHSESLSIWAYFASIWLTGMVFHKQDFRGRNFQDFS